MSRSHWRGTRSFPSITARSVASSGGLSARGRSKSESWSGDGRRAAIFSSVGATESVRAGGGAPSSSASGTSPSERYSAKRTALSPCALQARSARNARPAGSGRRVPSANAAGMRARRSASPSRARYGAGACTRIAMRSNGTPARAWRRISRVSSMHSRPSPGAESTVTVPSSVASVRSDPNSRRCSRSSEVLGSFATTGVAAPSAAIVRSSPFGAVASELGARASNASTNRRSRTVWRGTSIEQRGDPHERGRPGLGSARRGLQHPRVVGEPELLECPAVGAVEHGEIRVRAKAHGIDRGETEVPKGVGERPREPRAIRDRLEPAERSAVLVHDARDDREGREPAQHGLTVLRELGSGQDGGQGTERQAVRAEQERPSFPGASARAGARPRSLRRSPGTARSALVRRATPAPRPAESQRVRRRRPCGLV